MVGGADEPRKGWALEQPLRKDPKKDLPELTGSSLGVREEAFQLSFSKAFKRRARKSTC